MQISRAAYGDCIPLVYGRTRVPGTLIWYGDFKATPHSDPNSSGGKGGGGGGGSTSYTYSAALEIALCESPSTGSITVNTVYADKTQTDTTTLAFTLKTGIDGTAWSYLTSAHPGQAVPYDHTACIASSAFQLGSSAAMPNLTYELTGIAPFSIAYGTPDASAAAILSDYLTNVHHGAGFPYLDSNILSTGGQAWNSYCNAQGFFLSPAETTQRSASDFVNEICEITNSAPVWSAGKLKIIPHCDEAVNGVYGATGYSYVPAMSPIFDFDDNDFIYAEGEMPIICKRKPPSQRYNKVRVEYLNRANQYNTDIAEASDAADIAANGERTMQTLTYHAITTSVVARRVAQLRLQRELYVVNTYTFKVRLDYCLLEPMDLVTITESETGLNRQLVRILSIEDDADDNLTITAEEVPVGNANAPIYNWDDAQGYAANYGIDPGPVAPPLMFSAPPLLISTTAGGYELWIAVAGPTDASITSTGVGSAWGGCTVWVSFDNTNYKKAGVIRAPARYGKLHSSLASHADPDSTNTLVVDLQNANMQILPGTTADADNARSLIFVDGEIMSYRDASLTGTNQYSLGYLRRGKYGSTIGAHSSNTDFARLDDRIFKIPFDDGNIGQTIYLKFTSFNIYGGAEQSLASVTAYSRTLAAATVSLGTGADGQSVYVQYSADGSTGWHDPPFIPGTDNYMRIKQGSGAYSAAILITGSATGYKIVFKRSATQPSTPTGDSPAGWSTTPPATDGNPLWFSQAILNPNGTISGSWSTPVQLEGQNGFGTTALIFTNTARDSNNRISKTGGSNNNWDSQAYSYEGFKSTFVSAQAGQTNLSVMFGINSDPATNASYTSIDYAWYTAANGIAYIYESGTLVQTLGSYATTDLFSITQHEGTVRYYRNGTLARKTTGASASLYYFDSSFYSSGAILNSLRFLPPPTTGSIAPNAATEIISSSVAGPITVPSPGISGFVGSPWGISTKLVPGASVSIPAQDDDCLVTVIVDFAARQSVGNSTTQGFTTPLCDQSGNVQGGDAYSAFTVNNSSALPFSVSRTFTILAGSSFNVGLGVWYFTPSSVPALEFANINTRVEIVKR